MGRHDDLAVALTPLIDVLERLGVIELRGTDLDVVYLNRWAPVLGVADLLDSVLEETRERR